MALTNGFWGLLGWQAPNKSGQQLDRIRVAMLDAMDAYCNEAHVHADRLILFATDLEALWYLRSDLMHAIASCQNEMIATRVIQDITALFKGHLALAESSRFVAV